MFPQLNRNQIGHISAAGTLTFFPVPTAAVFCLAIASDGALFACVEDSACSAMLGDTYFGLNNALGRLNANGVFASFPLPLNPNTMTIGADGALW